jgi:hypothetical protein
LTRRKQYQLKAWLQNKRLPISTALSLLSHLLIFFSINIYLQFHPTIPKEKKVEQLEVRFAQPVPPKPQPAPEKKLLTTTTPAPFKVAQVPVEKLPVIAPTPLAPVVEQVPPATEVITGVALPGAIPTPFPGQSRAINPFTNPRSAQQDAAQTYYQQAMEVQARERNEYQARVIEMQLQQTLAKVLDVDPLVSGKCVLAEPSNGESDSFKCSSGALYETISNNQRNIAGMLNALRGLGHSYNGFSAEKAGQKVNISLTRENF